jgi:hypothetical protein
LKIRYERPRGSLLKAATFTRQRQAKLFKFETFEIGAKGGQRNASRSHGKNRKYYGSTS